MDNRPTHKEAFKAAKVLAAYCHDCNTQKCIFYDGFNGEEDTFCRNGSMDFDEFWRTDHLIKDRMERLSEPDKKDTDVVTISWKNGHYEVRDHVNGYTYTKSEYRDRRRELDVFDAWSIAGRFLTDFEHERRLAEEERI